MSSETEVWNGYESNLAAELASGELSVMSVDSIPSGWTGPVYLCIEPDVPASREWIRAATVNVGLGRFETLTRNLTGSAGDLTHGTNSIVRSVTTRQLIQDIFTDIEALETSTAAHAADSGDPHSAAGYLKAATAATTYVALTGDTMTGLLTLSGDPSTNLQAATKQYVDTHALASGAHHTRYADNEAVTALATADVYVQHGGDTMTGALNMGNQTLLAPLDPTLGTHVGDRDYNDTRYAQLSGATFTGPVAMGNQTLSGPLDPTAGTHVGDRDYNDLRYMAIGAAPNAHTIASHSDTTATGAQLDSLVGGGTITLHDHETQALHPGTAVSATEPRVIRSSGTATGTAINGSLWVQY